MIIEEFEPDVFRQLIEYIHTGCVLLQARTLLGLLNAADYYGLEQLRKACLRFVSCCITVDTVCSLLSTAERYIQYKCTKSIVQKVLEFVDSHANEIFKLNAFGLLPEHVVRLILARDGLQADEHNKYNGVYTWCEHYCRSYELTNLADIMHNFLDLIQFHKIPTNVLLGEIYPMHVVPDHIFLSALAYQADPSVFEPLPSRPRRMTLPNTIMFKDYDDTASPLPPPPPNYTLVDDDDGGGEAAVAERRSPGGDRKSDHQQAEKRVNYQRRQSNSGVARRDSSATTSSQQKLALSSRKSTGGGGGGGMSASATPPPAVKTKAGRKGSIAQAGISGVMRLSHKLSIRRRGGGGGGHSAAGTTNDAKRRGSSGAGIVGVPKGQSGVSKQTSLAYGAMPASGGAGAAAGGDQRDPIQLGRRILDAYLAAQRQRELEEEEQRHREEAEQRAADEAKRRAAGDMSTSGPDGAGGQPRLSAGQQQRALAKRPLVKTPSSTRKSFRDFKHISRRLFMRHSSSKTILQTQQSSASMTSATNVSMDRPSTSEDPVSSASLGRPGDGPSRHSPSRPVEKAPSASSSGGAGQQFVKQAEKVVARKLLKIKRSETVFEATPSSGGGGSRLFSKKS